jgi:hypothetical protein
VTGSGSSGPMRREVEPAISSSAGRFSLLNCSSSLGVEAVNSWSKGVEQ